MSEYHHKLNFCFTGHFQPVSYTLSTHAQQNDTDAWK